MKKLKEIRWSTEYWPVVSLIRRELLAEDCEHCSRIEVDLVHTKYPYSGQDPGHNQTYHKAQGLRRLPTLRHDQTEWILSSYKAI
jgi:hypothetical protein